MNTLKIVEVVFLLAAAAAAAVSSSNLELPPDFNRCGQNDPGLNECLRNSVPDALRKMVNGIPSLGVPPLEPLDVAAIEISSGGGPVRITQSYKNIKLHGLTTSKLINYNADLKHYRIRTDSFTPKLTFLADYTMGGRILVLPIQGKGRSNITMVNLKVKHDLIGEPITKDGVVYMRIKDYRVQFEPKKIHFYFGNLFNGDKLLGDQMNRILNENSELVFNELKSSYEQSFSRVFQDVTNKIFTKVPFHKIFPES